MYNTAYDALHYYDAQRGYDVSYRQGVGVSPPQLSHCHLNMIRHLEIRFLIIMQPVKNYMINEVPFFAESEWLKTTFPAIMTISLHSPPGPLCQWRYMSKDNAEEFCRGYQGLQQLFHRYCMDQTAQHIRNDERTKFLHIEIIHT